MTYGSGNISTTRASTTKMKEAKNVSNQLTKPLMTSKPTSSLDVKAEKQSVTLVREQFDKNAFQQTVNTQFTELGVQEPDLSFFDPNLANVGDFFSIYNNLFFLIPKEGPNSHTTLIEESTEYVDYQANQTEIQALLDEIAELREQNLQLTLDIGNLADAQSAIDSAVAQVEALGEENES